MSQILILLIVLGVLSSCEQKPKDKDIVLVTESLMGSLIHLATFNGNSATQSDDCKVTAVALIEKYKRIYDCKEYGSIKKDISK